MEIRQSKIHQQEREPGHSTYGVPIKGFEERAHGAQIRAIAESRIFSGSLQRDQKLHVDLPERFKQGPVRSDRCACGVQRVLCGRSSHEIPRDPCVIGLEYNWLNTPKKKVRVLCRFG